MSVNKWVVDIKGHAGSSSFEISVLRDNNDHGKRSYGWIGENKLLITHNGGPCTDPLIGIVWDEQIKLANKIAERLNSNDGVDAFEQVDHYDILLSKSEAAIKYNDVLKLDNLFVASMSVIEVAIGDDPGSYVVAWTTTERI